MAIVGNPNNRAIHENVREALGLPKPDPDIPDANTVDLLDDFLAFPEFKEDIKMFFQIEEFPQLRQQLNF